MSLCPCVVFLEAERGAALEKKKDMKTKQGFDEYMNLTLDDAEELDLKKKTRKQLGRILLKGDNITLLMKVAQ